MTSPMQTSTGRSVGVPGHVPALDGLRGAAACVVVAAHSILGMVGGFQFATWVAKTPFGFLLNARVAVEVFFVLSGFVLAGSLARSPDRSGLVQYFVRRVFRIHPAYVAAVVFAWLASFAYGPLREGVGPVAVRLAEIHLSADQLLRSFAFPGRAYQQLPVGWTLEVEMIFSFLLPALLLVARRLHWVAMLLVCLAPMAVGPNGHPVLKYGIDFALGAALFLERRRLAGWLNRIGSAGAVVWLVVWLAIANIPRALGWPYILEGESPEAIALQSLGSAGLVAGAAFVLPIARVLSLRPFLFLGRISYSLYLVHFSIVLVLASLRLGTSDLWLPPAVFATSILVSMGLYRWVERPSITAGNRASVWLAGRLGVPAVVSSMGDLDRTAGR